MPAPALWRSRPDTWFALAALSLVAVLFGISLAVDASGRSAALELGITLDLTFGLPLLGYLLLVRTGRVRSRSLLPLGLLGLALSRMVIAGPAALRDPPWELALIAVGLGALMVIGTRTSQIEARYSRLRHTTPHPSDAMRLAFAHGLGPHIGGIAFREAAVLWYAFTGWGRAPSPSSSPGAVDLAAPRGQAAIVGALSLLVVVETLALHLLLHLWDPRVAWLFTFSSMYTILWLLGDVHASRLVPTRVSPRGLHLRAGLRWRMDVEWDQVAGIHSTSPGDEALSMTFLRPPDLWIEFHAPQKVTGPMGITRSTSTVGLGLQDPAQLRRQCASYVGQGSPDAPR